MSRCFDVFHACECYFESQAWNMSQQVKEAMDKIWPSLADEPTLSRKVLRLYLSLEGLDCILLGARKTGHVQEMIDVGPPLNAEETFERLVYFHSTMAGSSSDGP